MHSEIRQQILHQVYRDSLSALQACDLNTWELVASTLQERGMPEDTVPKTKDRNRIRRAIVGWYEANHSDNLAGLVELALSSTPRV